jgi:hypothetical protein
MVMLLNRNHYILTLMFFVKSQEYMENFSKRREEGGTPLYLSKHFGIGWGRTGIVRGAAAVAVEL